MNALDLLFALSVALFVAAGVLYFVAPKRRSWPKMLIRTLMVPALMSFPVGVLGTLRQENSAGAALLTGMKISIGMFFTLLVFEPLRGLSRRSHQSERQPRSTPLRSRFSLPRAVAALLFPGRVRDSRPRHPR